MKNFNLFFWTTTEESKLDDQLLSIIEELQSTYEELKRQNAKYDELKSKLAERMDEMDAKKSTSMEKQKVEEKKKEIKRRISEMDIDL